MVLARVTTDAGAFSFLVVVGVGVGVEVGVGVDELVLEVVSVLSELELESESLLESDWGLEFELVSELELDLGMGLELEFEPEPDTLPGLSFRPVNSTDQALDPPHESSGHPAHGVLHEESDVLLLAGGSLSPHQQSLPLVVVATALSLALH